jgi:hypothetical protein
MHEISKYREISKHFSNKTGKHCEFTQDKETMFLKINHKVIKLERLFKDKEVMNIDTIISSFEKNVDFIETLSSVT